MLRSIAELAAYGTFAALLAMASLAPESTSAASFVTTATAAPSSKTPTRASPERGRMLFATKGCVGCHIHAEIPAARMWVGPDLTGLAARAATRLPGTDARAYVRQSLRDPNAYRVPGFSSTMPQLGLSDDEIESLAALLLSSTP
ncbi:MAG: c-type cytochrome [Chloroflexota bacterium]